MNKAKHMSIDHKLDERVQDRLDRAQAEAFLADCRSCYDIVEYRELEKYNGQCKHCHEEDENLEKIKEECGK